MLNGGANNRRYITKVKAFSYSSGLGSMSDNDTEEERSFRERYANELRKKKQQDVSSYREKDELFEERVKVNQQEMKTPGRRGEKIKQEEIDKEIVRRDKMKSKQ